MKIFSLSIPLLAVLLLCKSTCMTVAAKNPAEDAPSVTWWTSKDFPNPESQPGKCQTTSNQLCDPDGLLTDVGRKRITDSIKSVELEISYVPSCPASESTDVAEPVQIAVAVVQGMDLTSYYGSGRKNDAAKDFAVGLHDDWGVGTNTVCGGTGILVFLSVQDRVMYISRGKALDSLLSGWSIDLIVDSVKPFLRQEDYSGALSRIVGQLGENLMMDSSKSTSIMQVDTGQRKMLLSGSLFVVSALAFCWFSALQATHWNDDWQETQRGNDAFSYSKKPPPRQPYRAPLATFWNQGRCVHGFKADCPFCKNRKRRSRFGQSSHPHFRFGRSNNHSLGNVLGAAASRYLRQPNKPECVEPDVQKTIQEGAQQQRAPQHKDATISSGSYPPSEGAPSKGNEETAKLDQSSQKQSLFRFGHSNSNSVGDTFGIAHSRYLQQQRKPTFVPSQTEKLRGKNKWQQQPKQHAAQPQYDGDYTNSIYKTPGATAGKESQFWTTPAFVRKNYAPSVNSRRDYGDISSITSTTHFGGGSSGGGGGGGSW